MEAVQIDPDQITALIESINAVGVILSQIRVFVLWQLGLIGTILVFTIFDPLRNL